MQTINSRLLAARKALHMTQPQLADRLGVGKAGISRWEQDGTVIAPRYIKLINQLLGVSERWLLTGEGEMLLDRKGYLLSSLENQWNLPADEAKMIVDLITALPDQRKQLLASIAWPKKRRAE